MRQRRQSREKLDDFFLVPTGPGAGQPLEASELEILRNRHSREQAAALRNIADAVSRDHVGGQAGHIVAGEPDRARRRCAIPISVFSKVDLPAPLRPNKATIRAHEVKRHGIENVTLPVKGIHSVYQSSG